MNHNAVCKIRNFAYTYNRKIFREINLLWWSWVKELLSLKLVKMSKYQTACNVLWKSNKLLSLEKYFVKSTLQYNLFTRNFWDKSRKLNCLATGKSTFIPSIQRIVKLISRKFLSVIAFNSIFPHYALGLHNVRIGRIFSVKSTYQCKTLPIFYSVKRFLLRKTNTSNSLQAWCRNENWSKFSKISCHKEVCRPKSPIWHLGVKM